MKGASLLREGLTFRQRPHWQQRHKQPVSGGERCFGKGLRGGVGAETRGRGSLVAVWGRAFQAEEIEVGAFLGCVRDLEGESGRR